MADVFEKVVVKNWLDAKGNTIFAWSSADDVLEAVDKYLDELQKRIDALLDEKVLRLDSGVVGPGDSKSRA